MNNAGKRKIATTELQVVCWLEAPCLVMTMFAGKIDRQGVNPFGSNAAEPPTTDGIFGDSTHCQRPAKLRTNKGVVNVTQ